MKKDVLTESFYRPWNNEELFFPCQHCQCRHEVGAKWECPLGTQSRQEEQQSELVYVDNNLLNPAWLLTKGYGIPKGATYWRSEGTYKDGVLSYAPLVNIEFPLLSFELSEGPRFVEQYYLRVHSEDIFAAIEFAEQIGELHILEDIFFDFYKAVMRCTGMRYANMLFGWIIKDFADITVPVFGKIFREGALTYIDIRMAPLSKYDIDDYLGGNYSDEDGEFYTTESTNYLDGNWGFDYIESGECTDYFPICDLIEGEEQCGLLIDGYWLQDGIEYDLECVLHLFTVILDWIMDMWTTADALAVANSIVKEIPMLNRLVAYLKDALVQEIEAVNEA